MPRQTFRCCLCQQEFEQFIKVEDHRSYTGCKCGGMARIQIGTPAVDCFQEYYDPIQRRRFTSRRDFNSYCAKNNMSQPTSHEIREHREESEHAAWEQKKGSMN